MRSSASRNSASNGLLRALRKAGRSSRSRATPASIEKAMFSNDMYTPKLLFSWWLCRPFAERSALRRMTVRTARRAAIATPVHDAMQVKATGRHAVHDPPLSQAA